MTIKRKLILTFLLLILLPTVALQLWSFQTVTRIMVENVCQAELNTLHSTMRETSSLFSEMNRILVWLAADQETRLLMQTEMRLGEDASAKDRYTQMQASEKILDRSQLLLMAYPFDILLVPVDGTAYGTCENLPAFAKAVREAPWYDGFVRRGTGKIRWADISEPDLILKDNVFYAALPIHGIDRPRETTGIAYISIQEELVWKTLQDVNPHGSTYLINSDGIIVSAKDKSMLRTPLAALIDEVEHENDKSTDHFGSVKVQGQPVYALRSSRISGNWEIVTFLPQQIVLEQIYEAQKQLMLLYLVIVLATMGVALLLAEALSRPIVRLSQTACRVEEGDLNARVPQSSHGEIGALERNFNRMVKRITTMMQELQEQERKRSAAEMDALQAQINPHFLFNVLSSIRWASKEPKVEKMVVSLCSLLKASICRGGTDFPLDEECTLLRQYVELNNMRHAGQVTFLDELPMEMRDLRIPHFLLQPLVENSILHGFEGNGGTGEIRLQGELRAGGCLIRVRDNGSGFPPDFVIGAKRVRNRSAFSSIALNNILERLRLHFGEEAYLKCETLRDAQAKVLGAQVTLYFPLQKNVKSRNIETQEGEHCGYSTDCG